MSAQVPMCLRKTQRCQNAVVLTEYVGIAECRVMPMRDWCCFIKGVQEYIWVNYASSTNKQNELDVVKIHGNAKPGNKIRYIYDALCDLVPVTFWRWSFERMPMYANAFFYIHVVTIRLHELAWHSNGSIKCQTGKMPFKLVKTSNLMTFEWCFLIS